MAPNCSMWRMQDSRVNSSVFSLVSKVPRVLAVLVFTVSWFQTVGAATETPEEIANGFYPRDAMLARVFAIATCPSVCLSVRPSVCLSHAGIVPSRAKAGS